MNSNQKDDKLCNGSESNGDCDNDLSNLKRSIFELYDTSDCDEELTDDFSLQLF